MTYPHQVEIARWLEDYARWSPGGGGGGQWQEAIDSSGYRIAPVPIMAGEAADTLAALLRMVAIERSALEQLHLHKGGMKTKAAKLGLKVRRFQIVLHQAHHHFYELRWDVVTTARAVARDNAAMAKASSGTGRRSSLSVGSTIRVGKVSAR